jgi:hypothetical protein
MSFIYAISICCLIGFDEHINAMILSDYLYQKYEARDKM